MHEGDTSSAQELIIFTDNDEEGVSNDPFIMEISEVSVLGESEKYKSLFKAKTAIASKIEAKSQVQLKPQIWSNKSNQKAPDFVL